MEDAPDGPSEPTHHVVSPYDRLAMSEETSAAAEPVPPPRPAFRRLASWARPVPMLSLALVASLLLSAFLVLRGPDRAGDAASEAAEDRQELAAVAETYALNLTTYDSARLEEDFARVMDVAVGEFRTDYEEAQRSLRELITTSQGRATGRVLARAVLGLEGERGEVLLFVDQTVASSGVAQPRLEKLRMRMRLEKQSGRWMINKLDLL